MLSQSETRLDSRPFSSRTYPQGHKLLGKGISKWSHIELSCASGLGMIVAWKPFPSSPVFKYTYSNLPGMETPLIQSWTRLKESVWTEFSLWPPHSLLSDWQPQRPLAVYPLLFCTEEKLVEFLPTKLPLSFQPRVLHFLFSLGWNRDSVTFWWAFLFSDIIIRIME